MNLTELTYTGLAGEDVRRLRWELFIFRDVRDVLPTGRTDTVVVVHRGSARQSEWIDALVAAGILEQQPLHASRPER